MQYEDFEMHIPLSIKDITFISHTHSYDEDESLKSCTDLQRINKKIQFIQQMNLQLASEIQYIKQNPHSVGLDALGEQLIEKIELLKKQNAQLKMLMKRNKDETPMKRDSMRDSFKDSLKDSMRQSLNTPRKHKRQTSKHTIQKSSNRNLRISSNSILDEIDNNFYLEKAEVSTCQNYQMTYSKREKEEKQEDTEIEKLKPLTEKENKIKNGLKLKATAEAAKESLVSNRLKSIINDQKSERQQVKQAMSAEQVERMNQYKQKLIKRLKTSTLKQDQLKKILSQLDRLYTGSVERYKELQSILQQHLANRQNLESEQADIIQRYHEALKLQQILNNLNKQYQTLKKSNQDSNEQQLSRLKSIKRELISILNKLKLKCNIQGMGIAESIEMMSIQILNNVYIPNSKSMNNIQSKVLRIRELCEQQKEANAKIISQLKNKEQVLGKELLEKQMSKAKK